MKFASVSNEFFELCEKHGASDELLYNKNRRPYLFIIKLKYKNENRAFALPFRSDISATTPKDQYFSLPPRPTTKPGRKHGLHYIKLFPISKNYLRRYRIDKDDDYYKNILKIIDKNEKEIVTACQQHLNKYETEGRVRFSPDIDKIIEILSIPAKEEAHTVE